MNILAIESSCDETAVALYRGKDGMLIDTIHSQADEHAKHGGVVPELAARDHQEKIVQVCQMTLDTGGVNLNQIDGFAYTKGPGLVGPLLIGSSFTRALALATKRPVYPIHHLESHICIAKYAFNDLDFPFIALLVSGGHTAIILAKSLGQYDILGETLDDAAGEAFDKGAKVLGLSYPGGPQIALAAEKYNGKTVVPTLPQPMMKKKTLDFSFSGLKTAFNQAWGKVEPNESNLNAFAYSLQETIANNLIYKIEYAMISHPELPLVVAGGVAANKNIRAKLDNLGKKRRQKVYYPEVKYCTDNAAMVAYTAYLRIKAGLVSTVKDDQDVLPRWPINQL